MHEILDKIKSFRDDRGWDEYDTPARIARSIVIEASELLENYQWDDEARDIENVKEEIADVLIYTFTLCDIYGFDIEKIIDEKLEKNAIKYPPLEDKKTRN